LKRKKSGKQQGFITLEILIALFIALGFVAVSMQTLVYAMGMKVQAQEKQRANQLIQEDIEQVNELGSTALTGACDPANYGGGYAQGLWDSLPTATPTKKLLKTSDTSGKVLGLRRVHVSAATTASSDAPHRTLKIRDEVWGWNGSNFVDTSGVTVTTSTTEDPIAETYVEVIPDVALACP